MKHLSKVLAVSAPVLGVLGVLAILDAQGSAGSGPLPPRLVDPSHPDFGRTRDLPETGSQDMTDQPTVEAIPLEKAYHMLPSQRVSATEQVQKIRR